MVGLSAWHFLFLLVFVIPLALWLVAVVHLSRSGAPGSTIALWILIVTLVPVVGPILWFAIGRKSAGSSGPATTS